MTYATGAQATGRPTGVRWYEGRKGRNRLLLVGFAVLASIGVLLPAIYNHLLAGDRREVVVTMQQGVTDADRTTLKQACGSLPGISLIADKGRADAQYRFPVRFFVGDSTTEQESALYGCINAYPQLVRGVITENDSI